MKLSTESIKSILTEKGLYNAKRMSKRKNNHREIVREFSTDNGLIEVISDPTDSEILQINKKEEASAANVKNPFHDYYFAIATTKDEDTDSFLVSIIRKKFWDKNKHSDDSPCKIEHLLPEYISDLNESSDMSIDGVDWIFAFNDLELKGFEYNNDLAIFLETTYEFPAHRKN